MQHKKICLIPAAGKGTRMQPLTYSLPKAMLPIAGKPMIYHIIDAVSKEGVQDFVIITGYLKELMENEIIKEYPSLNFKFVFQEEQKGLGHACLLAKKDIKPNDSLLIIYGDTIFQADIKKMLSSEHPIIGVKEVDDPRRFGIVECTDNSNQIKNFVEKPDNPTSNLAIPGVNFFPNAKDLFDSLEYIVENDMKTKGEYQITDAFSRMLQLNYKMEVQKIEEWLDAGTLEKIIETNETLTSRLNFNQGLMQNSKMIEPVCIAEGAQIINSTIGPYVSVSKNSIITNTTISNSIVDQDASIINSDLKSSLVGRSSIIQNAKGKFILADKSQILLTLK